MYMSYTRYFIKQMYVTSCTVILLINQTFPTPVNTIRGKLGAICHHGVDVLANSPRSHKLWHHVCD